MGGLLTSVIWYASALPIVVGALGILRPMRRLGLPTRRRALTVLVIALGVLVVLANLRAPATTGAPASSRPAGGGAVACPHRRARIEPSGRGGAGVSLQ